MKELSAEDRQQYLRLLSIFHYVVAGMVGLMACFPLIHVAVGIALLVSGDEEAFIGAFFALIGGAIVLGGWAVAVLVALGGRFLGRRTHYTYCLIAAGVACLVWPLGTALGVLTVLLLVRPEVKAEFGR